MAKNIVTAGDYKGGVVVLNVNLTKGNEAYILKPQNFLVTLGKGLLALCTVGIALIFFKSRKVWLNKKTIDGYEVLGEESTTSASSAVARGAIGAAILGPIGIAAALSAKKKGVHTVAIQFKDGKRSLLEVADDVYKVIEQALF